MIEADDAARQELEDIIGLPTDTNQLLAETQEGQPIMYAEDLQNILAPIKSMFSVYREILFHGDQNTTSVALNETYMVENAGTYTTYFLMGKMKTYSEQDDEGFFNGLLEDNDDRVLRASN